MIGVVFVIVVLLVVVKWRLRHHHRRTVELGAAQAARRPLSDFDARMPADRRVKRRKHRGRRWGF